MYSPIGLDYCQKLMGLRFERNKNEDHRARAGDVDFRLPPDRVLRCMRLLCIAVSNQWKSFNGLIETSQDAGNLSLIEV